MYRKRIGLVPNDSGASADPIFAGFKRGAFSIYLGDAPIVHFDLDGRWQRAFVGGIHYLKGLDGTVHAVDRVRDGPNLVLKRWTLSFAEASDFDASVRAIALDIIGRHGSGALRGLEPPAGKAQPLAVDDLTDFLERIGRWDSARWFAHRERYLSTYGPLPFLPPECVNAVVLQATLGHQSAPAFGLSPSAEFYVRSAREFERHAREVSALWGSRLLQSRSIFMAGPDVLRQPPDRVAAYLETIRQIFPIGPKLSETEIAAADAGAATPRFDGVHVFVDAFEPSRPARADLIELAARGLIRISLGIESGDGAVRAHYGKSWSNQALLDFVADLKAAGLGVSILTLVGAGGREHSDAHVRNTVELINALVLATGDFVFLLDENEIRDPAARLDGTSEFARAAWSEQERALKDALMPLKQKGVKVLPYTMDKQWT